MKFFHNFLFVEFFENVLTMDTFFLYVIRKKFKKIKV